MLCLFVISKLQLFIECTIWKYIYTSWELRATSRCKCQHSLKYISVGINTPLCMLFGHFLTAHEIMQCQCPIYLLSCRYSSFNITIILSFSHKLWTQVDTLSLLSLSINRDCAIWHEYFTFKNHYKFISPNFINCQRTKTYSLPYIGMVTCKKINIFWMDIFSGNVFYFPHRLHPHILWGLGKSN